MKIRTNTSVAAAILLLPLSAEAEPMFDNNGFTMRDKLKTVAVGYGSRAETFKRAGEDGSTFKFQSNCISVGFNYGTKESQSAFFSASHCIDLESAPGHANNSARHVSFGYIYADPQTSLETYSLFTVTNYPAINSGFSESSRAFSGSYWTVGIGIDIYDGPQFSISSGYELDLYSKFESDVGSVSIKKADKHGGYLKLSYLLANDWTIASRLYGTAIEGAGLTIMKSF